MTPPWLHCDRQSRDAVINSNAPLLAELCSNYNPFILNGTPGAPLAGDFTFLSPNGASVVDYILASPDLLAWCHDFSIGDHSDSDHLPLLLSFLTPSFATVSEVPPSNRSRCPRWSSQTAVAFDHCSISPDAECLRLTIKSTTSPDAAFLAYHSTIQALPSSILFNSVQPSKRNGSPSSWFDTECWSTKHWVRHLFRPSLS